MLGGDTDIARHNIKLTNTRAKRFLIINNYFLYINIKFINFTNSQYIIILILSLYITYRLQPLNIRIFELLTIYYLVILDELIINS